MVSEIKRIIEDGPLGVRTIEKFVQACLQHAAAGDQDAVGLFVFAKLAEPFGDYYADQALSQDRAVAFREGIVSQLSAYQAAATVEAKQTVLRDAIRSGLEDSGR